MSEAAGRQLHYRPRYSGEALRAWHKRGRQGQLKRDYIWHNPPANFRFFGLAANATSQRVKHFTTLRAKIGCKKRKKERKKERKKIIKPVELIHVVSMSLLLVSRNGCQSGGRPAGVETADLLSVKNGKLQKKTVTITPWHHTSSERKRWREGGGGWGWGGMQTNFYNKPVNTPIWIPRSHNCLNSPPLAIVIIADTLLRDSISSINQSHARTHTYAHSPLITSSLFVPLYP